MPPPILTDRPKTLVKIGNALGHPCTLIPPDLVTAYRDCLDSLGLLEDALGPDPKSPVGGPTQAETHTHFAHRFAASAVRIEHLLLEDKSEIQEVADDLLLSLQQGKVSILYLPSGCGAGVLGLLATINELRRQRTIPSLPLDVSVWCADISTTGHDICGQLALCLQPNLGSLGINFAVHHYEWDAYDLVSTVRLMDQWLAHSRGSDELVVLIHAASGTPGFIGKAGESIKHIYSRLLTNPARIIWVEPKMRDPDAFFERLGRIVEPVLFALRRWLPFAVYRWLHPIKKVELPGSLVVREYHRVK